MSGMGAVWCSSPREGSETLFDTVVTVVGNALNTPEWRRLGSSQTLVARFRVAATSRRYDRAEDRWTDGPSLRVRVNCWRRLGENVAASVLCGDPVIVTGRLYTRDWTDEDGHRRVSYELDAVSVGHDLARGQGRFTRSRPSPPPLSAVGGRSVPTPGGEDLDDDLSAVTLDSADMRDSVAVAEVTGSGPAQRGAYASFGGTVRPFDDDVVDVGLSDVNAVDGAAAGGWPSGEWPGASADSIAAAGHGA